MKYIVCAADAKQLIKILVLYTTIALSLSLFLR